MTTNRQGHDHKANTEPDKHDSKLERIVKKVEPPGHEVTDDDMRDPGRMTPKAPPTENQS